MNFMKKGASGDMIKGKSANSVKGSFSSDVRPKTQFNEDTNAALLTK